MSRFSKLSHALWCCQYHIVYLQSFGIACYVVLWARKCTIASTYFAGRLGCVIIELNVQPDHVHLLVKIPPKVSISDFMGSVKSQTAIRLLKKYSTILPRQKERRIVERHLQPDHVQMLLLIPPKYSVSNVVGYMKGKIGDLHRAKFPWTKEKLQRDAFWARGYFVSTIGADEAMVRAYIHNQEQEAQRIEQLNLFK